MNTIFSITMVKNECDIIESFVRYHASLFDGMVILDNGSTDGTVEILLKMVAEGMPIYIEFDENPAYIQSEITTRLFYFVAARFRPDFIMPIDVDEFVTSRSGVQPAEYLHTRLPFDAITLIEWITYVPTSEDAMCEIDPLKRICHCRNTQHNFDSKIILPVALIAENKIVISQGNHHIRCATCAFSTVKCEDLSLAHYPIRSVDQARSKYLVGWLANLARPEQALFDWYYYYNILKGRSEISSDVLAHMAMYYDVADKTIAVNISKDPIDMSLVPEYALTYTSGAYNVTDNLLNYAESLARRYSTLRRYCDNASLERLALHYDEEAAVLSTIKEFYNIPGWLNQREACELYRSVRSLGNRIVVVEIGTWLGRSAYVLAKALQECKESILYCIDPFDGSGDSASASLYASIKECLRVSLLSKFISNMKEYDLMESIRVIQATSRAAAESFVGNIDFLFIDGDHEYASVLDDYQRWSPRINSGGLIAFHDVGAAHTFGPKQVVERYVAHNPEWSDHRLIDELYVARKI